MSEKLTIIRIPGQKVFRGVQDWGEHEADAMIMKARSYADHLRSQVEAIDAAEDHEFQIDVVRGPHVQRHVREVQASSKTKETSHDQD